MNGQSFSTYEAKARFSEVLRKVRKGRRVTITHRGKPVAEIVPYDHATESLEVRLARFEEEGAVERGSRSPDFEPLTLSHGALARFTKKGE